MSRLLTISKNILATYDVWQPCNMTLFNGERWLILYIVRDLIPHQDQYLAPEGYWHLVLYIWLTVLYVLCYVSWNSWLLQVTRFILYLNSFYYLFSTLWNLPLCWFSSHISSLLFPYHLLFGISWLNGSTSPVCYLLRCTWISTSAHTYTMFSIFLMQELISIFIILSSRSLVSTGTVSLGSDSLFPLT